MQQHYEPMRRPARATPRRAEKPQSRSSRRPDRRWELVQRLHGEH